MSFLVSSVTHSHPSFNCSLAAFEAQNILSPSPSSVLIPSALWFWLERSHACNTEVCFNSLGCSFGSQCTSTGLLCLCTCLLVCYTNHFISLDPAPIILQMPCWPIFGTILHVGCWFAMLIRENSALAGHYLSVLSGNKWQEGRQSLWMSTLTTSHRGEGVDARLGKSGRLTLTVC